MEDRFSKSLQSNYVLRAKPENIKHMKQTRGKQKRNTITTGLFCFLTPTNEQLMKSLKQDGKKNLFSFNVRSYSSANNNVINTRTYISM